MDELAAEIAHLLLREGAFDQGVSEHRDLYAQLLANAELHADVARRLEAVGYELVQSMGHAGIRVRQARAAAISARNNMGLHAGHVRLLVYLWTHLVYRERVELRRELESTEPGSGQLQMIAGDEPQGMSYKTVLADFAESTRKSHFTMYMRKLRQWRFIRYDDRRDRIWADAMLYTLIDAHQMEAFVVDLARRLGTEAAEDAVLSVATGTPIPVDGEEAP